VRRKRNRSEPLRGREITEQGLLSYPGAREAFERLTQQGGVDRRELLQLLCEIPSASPDKQPLVPGMAGRSLRALPDRILAWATEIERVNSSLFLDPKHLPRIARMVSEAPDSFPEPLNLTPEQAERRADNFQRLPNILRLYADYLREWLPFVQMEARSAETGGSVLSRSVCGARGQHVEDSTFSVPSASILLRRRPFSLPDCPRGCGNHGGLKSKAEGCGKHLRGFEY
jgi:hypothetical protein